MRVLHTSDWHLGIQLHGVSLLEEQKAAACFLAQTIQEEKIDAVILAGDMFDHAVPVSEAVSLYSNMMEKLCKGCHVPLLLCAGNHDSAARLSVCAPLLRDAGLYIAGSLSSGIEPIVIKDAAFFLLPYFNAEEARYLYPNREIRTVSDGMAVVCQELLEQRVPGKRNILVSHCFAAGGKPEESDRAAVLGTAGRIALAAFEGFDYVALGHLHQAQQFTIGNTMIRYSGTPYPYSFAEAGKEKTFTILDTDTMELSTVPVPLLHPLRILRGKREFLLEMAPFDPNKEDFIKIELTDTIPNMALMADFRAIYPNLLVFDGLQPEGQGTGLTVEELDTLRPLDLVTRFCEEIGGFTPEEDLLHLFQEEALHKAEEQGG